MKYINYVLHRHWQEAVNNIAGAKLRSFLAILGILVGTASVVAMVSSGELATREALAQFDELGTHLLSASTYSENIHRSNDEGPTLSATYVETIPQTIPHIRQVAPYATFFASLAFNSHHLSGSVIGVDDNFAQLAKVHMAQGRFISRLDGHNFYGVIGNDIATALRKQGIENPIGQQLKVGQELLTIVGVMKAWPENSFFNEDVNESVMVPIAIIKALSQYARINNMVFELASQADIDEVEKSIRQYIRLLVPDQKLFFRSAKQIIESMSHQRRILSMLLGLIGSISLIVGGIGVMNIMLVSVVERRREIGIRMAVGARPWDIQCLFLMESVVLTLFGGLLGVFTGIMIAYIISLFAHWHFTLFWRPPLIGFLVSVAIGIFFGYYPAKQAAQCDPIACLRTD
ncbi:MAG: ABC transporter permease [Gammaproteobacteria bacterium]